MLVLEVSQHLPYSRFDRQTTGTTTRNLSDLLRIDYVEATNPNGIATIVQRKQYPPVEPLFVNLELLKGKLDRACGPQVTERG